MVKFGIIFCTWFIWYYSYDQANYENCESCIPDIFRHIKVQKTQTIMELCFMIVTLMNIVKIIFLINAGKSEGLDEQYIFATTCSMVELINDLYGSWLLVTNKG